ncbi:MAG: hypothetical protein KF819_05200 [Labilithrix sp.]|nr:hypothetical protein [Labilithrix sp.]
MTMSFSRLLLSSAFGLTTLAMGVDATAQTPTQPPPVPPPEQTAQPAPADGDEAEPPRRKPKRRKVVEEEERDDDDEGGSFFFSANGPGPGKSQGVVGAGGLIASGIGGPGFTLGVNYGIAEVADFQLRTDLAVLLANNSTGVAGVVDPHFLLRLLGKRNMEANFGLKFGPEIVWAAAGGGGIAVFGVAPGLATSFGSSKVQGSINLDFPIYFAAAGSATGTFTSATIRPSVGVEGNVGGSTNLFLRIAPQFSLSGGSGYILSILTGVTF